MARGLKRYPSSRRSLDAVSGLGPVLPGSRAAPFDDHHATGLGHGTKMAASIGSPVCATDRDSPVINGCADCFPR